MRAIGRKLCRASEEMRERSPCLELIKYTIPPGIVPNLKQIRLLVLSIILSGSLTEPVAFVQM